MTTAVKSRGIRNNNPGNIRKGKSKWQGLSDEQLDIEFCTFKTPQHGIRALAIILKNYQRKYALNCIATIIPRYAPSSENNPKAYIDSVAEKTGFGAMQHLDLSKPEVMKPLVKAVIHHENGRNPYGDEIIDQAIKMAL